MALVATLTESAAFIAAGATSVTVILLPGVPNATAVQVVAALPVPSVRLARGLRSISKVVVVTVSVSVKNAPSVTAPTVIEPDAGICALVQSALQPPQA